MNKAFAWQVNAPSSPTVKATMNSLDWSTMWGGDTSGDLDEHGAYQAVAWVRRCLELRCNALSTIPVHVYSGETEVEWEFADLMPRFLWMTEASLQLYGAAYWIRERNRVKDKAYRWLNPKTITPKYDAQQGLVSFERKVPRVGAPITLSLDEVLYFWNPNLAAETGPGTGWVTTALVEAGVTKSANTFADAFFERGAIPAVLLSVDGNPADKELNRLEMWWRRMLQGQKRAWETVAVRASVKPQIIGYPTKDLAMPELMLAMRQQICAAAGVPQTMLEDAASYATATEHRESFYQETVVPDARLVSGVLNDQLFRPQGLELQLAHEELDIFQRDEAERAVSLQQLTSAGLPLDLAMEMLGFELPGGMTYEQLAERLKQEKDEAAARAPKFTPGKPGEEDEEPNGREAELRQWRRYANKRTGEKAAEFKCKDLPDDLAEVIRHRLVLAESPEEVKAAFSGPFLTAKANRVTVAGLVDPNSDAKNAAERRLRLILEERLDGQLGRVLRKLGNPPDISNLDAAFWQSEEGLLLGAVRPEVERLALEAGQRIMEASRLGIDWALVAEGAASWASAYGYDLVRGINDTNRQALQRQVDRYFREQGRTLGDLRDDLAPWFGRVRAERIAVTEVTRAAAAGERASVETAERAGYRMTPIWHTNRDDLVCGICEPMDSEPVTGEYPPAHPNCLLPGNSVVLPGELVAGAKSFYVGRAIEICLENGGSLTVTENHPILTPGGWVAAQLLGKGDHVIYCADSQRIATAIDPNNDHGPAVIEQVYGALKEAGELSAISMPVAPEDLHGDGRGVYGNIEIVHAHGALLRDEKAARTQAIGENVLSDDPVTALPLKGGRAPLGFSDTNDPATTGVVRVGEHGGALLGGGFGPTNEHAIGCLARMDAGVEQAVAERSATDSGLAREFLFRFASDVTTQEIVQIRDFDFTGHVYDLQCDPYELYITSGVVVKNCRCWITHEVQA